MRTEEQGLNSLCTEGHLGQDTADILNLLSSFYFFTSIFFPFFALWLIDLVQNENSDRAKDVYFSQWMLMSMYCQIWQRKMHLICNHYGAQYLIEKEEGG